MNKKLTVKTQKISNNVGDISSSFSKLFTYTSEQPEVDEKKGQLFGILEVTCDTKVEVGLVSNIITDLLRDIYFQDDSVSPIESLEKAVTAIKNKLNDMDSRPSLGLILGALWGEVMYIVNFGELGGYLMRTGEIKEMTYVTQGSFSIASGIVKDDDVLVFASKGFMRNYPVEKLLTTSELVTDLGEDQSALIMKFNVDTAFSTAETIKFAQRPEPQHFSFSFVELNLKNSMRLAAPALILLGIVGFAGYYFTPSSPDQLLIGYVSNAKNPETSPSANLPSDTNAGGTSTKNVAITHVNPLVFYDVALTDDTARLRDIAVVGEYVVVADPTSGKVFVSDISVPKFVAIDKKFEGMRDFAVDKGLLAFADKEGYKVYDPAKNEVKQDYIVSDLGVTATYLDFIYSTKGNTLEKYTKEDNGSVSSSVWGQSPAFATAISLAINGNILILGKDGVITEFASGIKTNFTVTGLEKGFSSPNKIVATPDFKNIYISDTGNKQVVVLDADGKVLKIFRHDSEDLWGDIRGIGVNADETNLYVLNGTRVYEVKL